MMKTKLVVATAIFASISLFSQEIKIKKGELLLDEKVVAKVADKGRLYTFSDLSGKVQFTGKIYNGTNGTPGSNASNGWVEFTGANGNLREVEFADVPFTLSMGKLLVQNAMAYKLITKDGIDEAQVNEFFQAEDRSLSSAKDNQKKMLKEETNNEDAIAKEAGLRLDTNGSILNSKGQSIGSIQRVSVDASESEFSRGPSASGMNKYYEYRVFDLNNVLIAKLPCSDSPLTNNNKGLKIYTYDGKEAPITANTTNFNVPFPADDIANRMVKKLYANGYTLGGENYNNTNR